jgi:hypothetical protein
MFNMHGVEDTKAEKKVVIDIPKRGCFELYNYGFMIEGMMNRCVALL